MSKYLSKPTLISSIAGGIVFGIAALVYASLPEISNYLWCFYVGYFMTVITGADKKNFAQYCICFLCGYFWAFFFWYGTDILLYFGMTSYPLARGVSDFMVTLIMLYMHCHILKHTPANCPPLMFAAVATIFGNHGFWEHLTKAGVSLYSGMILCLLCGIATRKLMNGDMGRFKLKRRRYLKS